MVGFQGVFDGGNNDISGLYYVNEAGGVGFCHGSQVCFAVPLFVDIFNHIDDAVQNFFFAIFHGDETCAAPSEMFSQKFVGDGVLVLQSILQGGHVGKGENLFQVVGIRGGFHHFFDAKGKILFGGQGVLDKLVGSHHGELVGIHVDLRHRKQRKRI